MLLLAIHTVISTNATNLPKTRDPRIIVTGLYVVLGRISNSKILSLGTTREVWSELRRLTLTSTASTISNL